MYSMDYKPDQHESFVSYWLPHILRRIAWEMGIARKSARQRGNPLPTLPGDHGGIGQASGELTRRRPWLFIRGSFRMKSYTFRIIRVAKNHAFSLQENLPDTAGFS